MIIAVKAVLQNPTLGEFKRTPASASSKSFPTL